jgi:hypothetical protein
VPPTAELTGGQQSATQLQFRLKFLSCRTAQRQGFTLSLCVPLEHYAAWVRFPDSILTVEP